MAIEKIDHFVVLMLENRSFDHVFGFREGVDGLKGDESNTVQGFDPVVVAENAPFEIPTRNDRGPLHNVVDVNLQLYGSRAVPADGIQPSMGGFAQSYLEGFSGDVRRQPSQAELDLVMQSFSPGALPAITALADEFVLCDRWFCEVPGPTHPNRLYVHAGTSAGYAHNVWDLTFNLLTIYELLQQNGQTWASYSVDDDEVIKFTRIVDNEAGFRKFDPGFVADVESGNLPNYSFIVPRFNSTPRHPANSQHAPHDVRYGDLLIADIYDALRGNEEIWNKCAFIVTYDEHGGFYDHVPPPAAPNPDGIVSPRSDDFQRQHHSAPPEFGFDRLGLRVPTLIASPWVKKGVVASTEYRHTSILKTVRERFGISRDLGRREATANGFAALFSAGSARSDCVMKLPRVSVPAIAHPDHHANPANWGLDDLQAGMRDGVIAMTRPSHPEDEDQIWVPKTQGENSEFIRRRLERHREFLRLHPRVHPSGQAAKEPPPPRRRRTA